MNCALILDIGRDQEYPAHKNAAGRALASYPLMAAKAARSLGRTYLLTDSQEIKSLALQYQPIFLDPPRGGPAPIGTLTVHGVEAIQKELRAENTELEILALMFTHAPCITGELIDTGVDALKNAPSADSAATVSQYEFWHPLEARRETPEGPMEPYIPASARMTLNASPEGRQHGDAPASPWYPDWGACLLRADGIKKTAANGATPLAPLLGRRCLPIKSWGASPVEAEWQVPGVEYWLKKHGITDLSTALEPQPQLKPQAAKGERR